MPSKPKRVAPAARWKTYEAVVKDGNGQHTIYPFSAALANSGTTPTQAVTKIRMVQDLGWPEARDGLKDNEGHHLMAKKDEYIWLLKCKPSCWRLYFYVREAAKQIIYVHAACKKQDAEDPADAKEARRVANGIQPGGSAIAEFTFPTG